MGEGRLRNVAKASKKKEKKKYYLYDKNAIWGPLLRIFVFQMYVTYLAFLEGEKKKKKNSKYCDKK